MIYTYLRYCTAVIETFEMISVFNNSIQQSEQEKTKGLKLISNSVLRVKEKCCPTNC